ncbi:hypothetical protein GCM10007907_07200 [Chitinimonas prasina]|uniref:PIG-L family deacetylase n=1 Tax=Chitinimonas prasina TaxID=1434937 RepID=A0ABQ5YAF4_9NEIS|nr:PIG-L family deacetylase [Chitinimonas prasina]GLR11930.1 hypothetical protein GCM10007907_07200 [Chitinimonas prasina]
MPDTHTLREENLVPFMAEPVTAARLLVFAPHPDDEVFGCGGTLALHAATGAEIQVVILTSGEHGEFGKDPAARRNESAQAASLLGYAAPVFWGLPDRGVVCDEALVGRMLALMSEFAPELVFAPSVWEVHPDHVNTALAALEAFRRWAAPTARLLGYEVGSALQPDALFDITTTFAAKEAAMAVFASQLGVQRYDRQISGLNRFRSYTLGAAEAVEAFHVTEAEDCRHGLPDSLQGIAGYRRVIQHKLAASRPATVSVCLPEVTPALLPSLLADLAHQTHAAVEVLVDREVLAAAVLPAGLSEALALVGVAEAHPGGLWGAASGHFGMVLRGGVRLLPDHLAKLLASLQEDDGAVLAVAACAADANLAHAQEGLLPPAGSAAAWWTLAPLLPAAAYLFRLDGVVCPDAGAVQSDWVHALATAKYGRVLCLPQPTVHLLERLPMPDCHLVADILARFGRNVGAETIRELLGVVSQIGAVQLARETALLTSLEQYAPAVVGLRRSLAERDTTLAQREATLAARDAELAHLLGDMASLRATIAAERHELAAQLAANGQLLAQQVALERGLGAERLALAQATAQWQQAQAQAEQLRLETAQRLAEQQAQAQLAQAEALRCQAQQYEASRSWRWTRPLRWLTSLLAR